MKVNKVYNMDCRVGLKQMISEGMKVQCIGTSPPYYGLRDYNTNPLIWDEDPNCEHDWGEIIEFNSNYRNDKGNLSKNERPDLKKIKCMREIVEKINKGGIYKTLASCCGHGEHPKTVVVKERETGNILEYYTEIPLQMKKRNRYYKKDNYGFYFIPKLMKEREK